MKKLLSLTIVALLFIAAGCSSVESRSQKLHLGMTFQQATDLVGSDYTVAAARMDPQNVPIKVIQYDQKKKGPLYLYFRSNSLVQWGDVSVLNAMPGDNK